jgi:MFS family permease
LRPDRFFVKFTALRPFRHRDFTLFWVGSFVSNIGIWMETIALGDYVATTTGKAFWSGFIAAAEFIPSGLLAPVGGVVADKFPRKKVLTITMGFEILGAGTLTVLAYQHALKPWLIAAIVFLVGICSAIAFPTFQSLIRDLVPAEEVTAAIGLGAAQWNLGRVIGPIFAGIVLSYYSIGLALLFNTLSFLAVLVAVFFAKLPPTVPRDERENWKESLLEGFRFSRKNPAMWVFTRAMLLNTILAAPFIALIPAVNKNALHGDKRTLSVLITCQGIGAVIGALALSGLAKRFGDRKTLHGLMIAIPTTLALYGLSFSYGVVPAALCLTFLGGFYMMALITFSSAGQTRAPAAVRGRVVSVNMTILGVLYPLGAIIQGALGDISGIGTITVAAAAVYGIVVIGTRLLRPRFTEILDVIPPNQN